MSSARTGTGTDTWFTPPSVLDRVRLIAPIFLDPCTSDENPVKASVFFTEATNGLANPWPDGGLAYVNWPYSRSSEWALKVVSEADVRRGEVIVLCAARPDTKWWQAMWKASDVLAFWRGRLRFVGAPSSAPFPSALFGLNVSHKRFRAAFADVANVVVP